MWNYFIFLSLVFLFEAKSHVTYHNKTGQRIYKRDSNVRFITEDFNKPESDQSSYRMIELPNGLKTLLISNPTTLDSGAALDVKVGHFSDPEGIYGVAHFCEHLLFMGTKKYPGEDDFSGYLSAHSGTYNAYTATEDTNYFFSITTQFYETALDMFSQFFISPLILKRSVEREARAVDSEHKKNLQSDAWRAYQLEKHLSNPNGPYSKFGTGNYMTLVDYTRKKGLDIASIVTEFYLAHYSANVMKLVLYSSKSLDELQNLAATYFTDIPNKNIEIPRFTEKPFGSSIIGREIWYKPIVDQKSLELVFPIETQKYFYKSDPVLYLGYFLDRMSSGSLSYMLREKGWATSMGINSEYIVSETDVLRITVFLTNEGLENYQDVVALIFKSLEFLKEKGPIKEYFDELAKIEKLNFRFKDQHRLMTYSSMLAASMQDTFILDRDLLSSIVPYVYSAENITNLFSQLNLDNFFIMMYSTTKPGVWDLREPWYDSEYTIKVINSTFIEKIKNYVPKDKFVLPEKNVYIPEIFIRKNASEHKIFKPTLVYNDSRIRYWYKEDDTFSSPKTALYAFMNIPDYASSPFEAVHSAVYTDMLQAHIYNLYYNAAIVGYNIALTSSSTGLFLSIYGYSGKILPLLDDLINTIKEYTPTNVSFTVTKEKFISSYLFGEYTSPFRYVPSVLSAFHNQFYWPYSDLLYAAKSMTFQDIYHFHKRRFSSLFTEVLAVGLLSNQTHDLLEIYFKSLTEKEQFPYQILPSRSFALREGSNFVYEMVNSNPSEPNSAILYSLQFGTSKDPRETALLYVLYNIIKSVAFDQLRTKEQLGYVVRTSVSSSNYLLTFFFVLQSIRDPFYLEQRINALLYKFAAFLDTLTDDEFKGYVDSLVTLTYPNFDNIQQESAAYANAILTGFYDFDYDIYLRDHFQNVTIKDVKDFFMKYFYPGAPNRKKLSFHLRSQALEFVSIHDLSPIRLQYYFKCHGLDITLSEYYGLVEVSSLLADLEEEIINFFKKKYPNKDVSSIVTQAFKYLKELYGRLKKDSIKDYGAVHFTDLAAFRNSLRLSPAPLPVMKWDDYVLEHS